MKAEAPITMSGLSVAHPRSPGLPILQAVDWEVAAGDCWVITGLQGSGKTVLLETAAGLHPILAGELRLFGQPCMTDDTPATDALRRRFGLVFDGAGRLFPNLTVWENITLPLRYHRNLSLNDATAAVAEIFQVLELEPYAHLLPGRLSRAWSRRVALARALALKPEVLLLDNPLAGLDSVHVRWWRALLGSFLSGHPLFGGVPRTVLIACDALRPLLPLGRSFALVHNGRWVELGSRQAVLDSTDPFVRDLLNETD